MIKANFKDLSTALSTASVFAAAFALGLPDPYSRAILALGVGLANAAVVASRHGYPETDKAEA